MQWIIQNTWIKESLTAPLVESLQKIGVPFYGVGLNPDADYNTILGLEDVPKDEKTFVFGSTKLVKLMSELDYKPGVFFNEEWFDPSCLIGKRDDLLNSEIRETTYAELKDKWITEPTFIKSVKPKILTGQVIEGEERVEWLEEHVLKDDDMLCLSSVQKIDKEWRFFLVAGTVVAGSLYRRDGCMVTREPISSGTWRIADSMAKQFLPHPTIVMDIALLRSGEYKVIEVNCICSSGAYNSNWDMIIKALHEAY